MTHGANQRDVARRLRELGAVGTVARRTGEVIWHHPRIPYRVRVNLRRKDAPRAMTSFLRAVERAQGGHK
ncbi:MAG TPA: hypothetical protein VLD58_07675 [Gemmatimonadales bacterium]|nr:hypothetical protein [Gemmatimonadales bacterium]